jgi:hypothetical protein
MSEVKLPSGSTIRYHEAPVTGHVKVKLDGVYVGSIVRDGRQWRYQPKGLRNPPGRAFDTVGQVKFSLEN